MIKIAYQRPHISTSFVCAYNMYKETKKITYNIVFNIQYIFVNLLVYSVMSAIYSVLRTNTYQRNSGRIGDG